MNQLLNESCTNNTIAFGIKNYKILNNCVNIIRIKDYKISVKNIKLNTLNNVTTIYISNINLNACDLIFTQKNLTYLTIKLCCIKKIPIIESSTIKKINIKSNYVTSLGNIPTSILELNVDRNMIVNIDIKYLINLKKFSCSHNRRQYCFTSLPDSIETLTLFSEAYGMSINQLPKYCNTINITTLSINSYLGNIILDNNTKVYFIDKINNLKKENIVKFKFGIILFSGISIRNIKIIRTLPV